jgi:glycosyltransferase involved in cell wall biosynthesis
MSLRRVTIVGSEILGMSGTGGAGTADSMVAVALGRHGHNVEVLVAPGREIGRLTDDWVSRYERAGVRVRGLAADAHVRPSFLAPTIAVLRALRAQPPDVVVANDWRGLAYAPLVARQAGLALAGTAFVVHCHSPGRVLTEFAQKVPDTLARFGEEVTERASLELADAVVSPSAWLLSWLRNHDWPVPESAAVIPYLLESTALDEHPVPAPAPEKIARLAFFGKLREGKGIRIFLAALAAIEPELLAGIELVFLGSETARWRHEGIVRALPEHVRDRLATVRVESELGRAQALAELRRPGTLAVMPSLLDNAPNTVSECLEHGIPFVATAVGGIPELVAQEDQGRVLAEPRPDALAAALTRALSSPDGFAPAQPAYEPRRSLDAWLALIEGVTPRQQDSDRAPTHVSLIAIGRASGERARRLAEQAATPEVEVVEARSRQEGLDRASFDWVVFLDEDDVPDDRFLEVLARAQASSQADVVTVAVRPSDDPLGMHVFLGNPGAAGLAANHYGVLALIRKTLVDRESTSDDAVDPDWPLLARLALAGAKIVGIPEPLAVHHGTPGRAGEVPGEGLVVLEAFEEVRGRPLRDLPQLAATLAAAEASHARDAPSSTYRTLVRRGAAALRARVLPKRVARHVRLVAERPPTLPSPLAARLQHRRDSRPRLHVLHLGKTGGTALKEALLGHLDVAAYRLLLHGHDVTLAHVPVGERFMFVVRDPVTRFVSAFNGRLREDRPRYHYRWRDEERDAFAVFTTPDELASALSASDAAVRTRAEAAMRGIGHVNTSYWTWFLSEEAFLARRDDIYFIAIQEQLDEDFNLLKRKLGLPEEARLPRDPLSAHRTPRGYDDHLSDVARANLERWYESDLAFYRVCRELAPIVNTRN